MPSLSYFDYYLFCMMFALPVASVIIFISIIYATKRGLNQLASIFLMFGVLGTLINQGIRLLRLLSGSFMDENTAVDIWINLVTFWSGEVFFLVGFGLLVWRRGTAELGSSIKGGCQETKTPSVPQNGE